jgi:hypothetical protein
MKDDLVHAAAETVQPPSGQLNAVPVIQNGKIVVDYILLRRVGDRIIVFVEVDGKEYAVITEHFDGPISHCVHPSGVERAVNGGRDVAV